MTNKTKIIIAFVLGVILAITGSASALFIQASPTYKQLNLNPSVPVYIPIEQDAQVPKMATTTIKPVQVISSEEARLRAIEARIQALEAKVK